MQDDPKHTFEYLVKQDSFNESSSNWGTIVGLLCGEICIHLLDKEKQDRYIEDEEYRSRIVNFIRSNISFRKRENFYSLCISLNKTDIQNL